MWSIRVEHDDHEVTYVMEESLGAAVLACLRILKQAKSHIHASMRSGPVAVDDSELNDMIHGINALYNRSPKLLEALLGAGKGSEPTYYAEVRWTAEDVKTLRPKWSLERCEEFLARNEKYLAERLTEVGWEAMATYISMDEGEGKK